MTAHLWGSSLSQKNNAHQRRYFNMASRETIGATTVKSVQPAVFLQERTDAAVALQKALLESYDQASRAWLARVQSEVTFWSDLATKVTATRTVPEALEAYSKCVSQRMQMAADDGRLLTEEVQDISKKFAQSLGNGWPTAAT
jgi:hypothetical protein